MNIDEGRTAKRIPFELDGVNLVFTCSVSGDFVRPCVPETGTNVLADAARGTDKGHLVP